LFERTTGTSGSREPFVKQARERAVPHGLFCATCRARVTTEEARIEVGGAHRHSFTNPGGWTYEIGCFAAADGCRVFGQPTLADTWFAGFEWSYATCANCDEHLGWCYEGPAAPHRFFGLILARLRTELEM
jgi:hypothetical protein